MKILFLTFIAFFAFSFTTVAQEQTERDKAIELYRQGEYEKAIGILQNSVKTEEKDRLAWLYLGASYVKLKKNEEAVNAFRKTNVIYKENLPTYDKKLKIISKPLPVYTESARRNGVSGKIIVAIEFGSDGKIGFIFPFRELAKGLTEKAVDTAKAIKFEAAVKDGKPVTVISILEYEFTTY
jgi:tetratricopeptide (TPR) repeat protein